VTHRATSIQIVIRRPSLVTLGVNDMQQAALLLNSREAARILAISPRQLWELTKQREIPCVRIRSSVRYHLADLQAWIEKLKAGE